MHHRTTALLAIVLVLAFTVRFRAIDRFATGYDELFSVLEANGLYPNLVKPNTTFTNAQLNTYDTWRGASQACIATDGGNGIAYILMLHGWTEAFGNSNLSIRFFSLCCGLFVVLLVYRLCRELTGHAGIALLSAALTAITPMLVDYSQEARAYMLAAALLLQATRVYHRVQQASPAPTHDLLVYGLLSGLALLAHYYAVYALAAHALHAVWCHPGRAWIRWGAHAVPVAAACLAAWLLLGGWEGLSNMGEHHASYVRVLKANPSYQIYYRSSTPLHLTQDLVVQAMWLGGNGLSNLGPSLRIMGLLLVLPLGLLLGIRWAPAEARRELRMIILLALAGPAYCIVSSAVAGHTFGMRYYYALFSVPFAAMLLAIGAWGWVTATDRWRNTLGSALLAGLIAVMAASVIGFYRHGYRGNDQPEALTPFASAVDATAAAIPDAKLLIVHGSDRDAIAFNLHLGPHAHHVRQVVDNRSPQRHAVLASVGGSPRVVLRLR